MKNNLTLQDLAVDHPYYGSGTYEEYNETFSEFYESMKDYDVDLNLCYRWDVRLKNDENHAEGYEAILFTIQQRKGRITSHSIRTFTEADVPLLQEYLKPHIEKLQELWKPFELSK